jgi:hypothetical protein
MVPPRAPSFSAAHGITAPDLPAGKAGLRSRAEVHGSAEGPSGARRTREVAHYNVLLAGSRPGDQSLFSSCGSSTAAAPDRLGCFGRRGSRTPAPPGSSAPPPNHASSPRPRRLFHHARRRRTGERITRPIVWTAESRRLGGGLQSDTSGRRFLCACSSAAGGRLCRPGGQARPIRAQRKRRGPAGNPGFPRPNQATSRTLAASASARSFLRLWCSICRIRSRVTLKARPTSSSVRGCWPSRP